MYIYLTPSGGRRYMAQEGITKLLNPELEEPTEENILDRWRVD